MKTLYKRLRDTWLSSGLSVNEGALPEAIDRLEKKRLIKLPRQFRDYLLEVGGMADGQTDLSLTSFLSLDAIDKELGKVEHVGDLINLIFAEYLIYSHYYTLRATRDGLRIGVYAADGSNEIRLASSFDEFIDAYLLNPDNIAECW